MAIPTVTLCCTLGARLLHYRCKAAATIGARVLPLFCALLEAAVFREFTYDVSIAMVYDGIPMLDSWYQIAGLLVPDSWTFGTRQLDFSGTIILKSLQWLFCRSSDVVS